MKPDWLDCSQAVITSIASIFTGGVAFMGYRLAKERWGFDYRKHVGEQMENRVRSAKELIRVIPHMKPEDLGGRLGALAEFDFELEHFKDLFRYRLVEIGVIPTESVKLILRLESSARKAFDQKAKKTP